MKQHLNAKNKILIIVFVIIILTIIGILVYSVKRVGANNSVLYNVTNKSVLFADDYSNIDTQNGGIIKKTWNSEYHYVSSDNVSYTLGNTPVIYEPLTGEVVVIGTKYNILADGTVNKTDDLFKVDNVSNPYFFKLQDRKYLIIYREIFDENKNIYTKNYLLVDIDKQGNASLLNDVLNVKTINPIKIVFENYTFDVANEKLYYKDSVVDLKQVIGSTNEYVPKEKKEVYDVDSKSLIESYNELVSDFTQYAKNHNYSISANNGISNNTVIINNNGNNSSSSANNKDNNKTDIIKMVSLRGVVTSVAYIDVTYTVTDPENKFQAVYLLVTGNINNKDVTQKIVIDKYNNKYRIPGVRANSEYTVSLGYIEIVQENGEVKLVDNIEDVINVRTKEIEYTLSIEKIAGAKVYFNYKMPTSYAFESVEMAFLVDGIQKEILSMPYSSIISSKGFSGYFELPEGNVYELRIKNAMYHSRTVVANIYKKFTLTS